RRTRVVRLPEVSPRAPRAATRYSLKRYQIVTTLLPNSRSQQPIAPLLIGVILGPLAETELRRALAVSEGDPAILISSPITIGIYVVLVGAIAVTAIQHLRHLHGDKNKVEKEANSLSSRREEEASSLPS
ncbi:hypothetical protein M5J06_09130, partial [Corynebacterium sp. B5-R-101]|nr:hypothetical protein [Corynebacterium intestinale]MCP1390521.1 hypothetical protein [Corynebacterium intestinale]